MGLHQEAVSPGGHGGEGQRGDQGSYACRMRGISEHRGGCGRPRERDGGHVERVARTRFECPYAALAQHKCRTPGHEQMLRGEQPLVDGGPWRTLEQDGSPRPPDRGEERVALTVAGTDLQEVDQVDGGGE